MSSQHITDNLNSVHPHRRGEHESKHGALKPVLGSSPQAWGTFLLLRSLSLYIRFIPTGVGNIRAYQASFPLWPVHPHRRGEHSICNFWFLPGDGSSPQAWGT